MLKSIQNTNSSEKVFNTLNIKSIVSKLAARTNVHLHNNYANEHLQS